VSWLGYLNDLGWEDLYLPPGALEPPSRPVPAVRAAEAPRPARPPGTTKKARRTPERRMAPQETSERRPPRVAASRDRELFASEDRPPILDQPVPEDPAERAAALVELGRFASTCELCGLAGGRNRVVFGSGDPHADLMFIGEGPGAEEDRQGLPFVGRAGELLTRIIRAIDRTREEVYIANIVKCRPPGNRDPRPEEVRACVGYLERQIELIRPKVIVALGRVAAQTLLGNDLPLGKMRGDWWLYQGVEMRVTYHPAALLRNQNLKRPTWEDMQVVRDRLRELTG
jgi:uracil-DNA glycosylase family 4